MQAMTAWRWALVGVALALPAAASSRTYGVHPPPSNIPGPVTQALREAMKRSQAEDYAGAARAVAAAPCQWRTAHRSRQRAAVNRCGAVRCHSQVTPCQPPGACDV
jgi:hypothetical protein